MMTSCRNIDLAKMMACGCGGRRQFIPLGNFSNTVCKFGSSKSYGGGNLVGSCKAVPTKSKEISLVNGESQQFIIVLSDFWITYLIDLTSVFLSLIQSLNCKS